jgi:hypothetical protein
VLLLGAAAEAGPRIGAGGEWYPLEKGNRWSYQLTRRRILTLPGGEARESRIEGRTVEEVTRGLGNVAGTKRAFEVVTSTSGEDVATQLQESTTQKSVVSSKGGILTMHTGEIDGAPIRVLRPMVSIPSAPRQGMKWDAGALIAEGLRFDLRGEVIGFEDVTTLAGSFSKCLKIRYTGTVSGSTTVEGMQIGLQGGTVDNLVWFAAGVGSVKTVTSFRTAMQLPNGMQAETAEEDTLVLEAYRIWPLVPAAPAR